MDQMTISDDLLPRSIATPEQHRRRAAQLREAGRKEKAEQFEKLADMIERRDKAIDDALGVDAGEGEV